MYVYFLECSHVLPKLRYSDVASKFTDEFFKHLVTKCELTERLLHYVVLKLPDSKISKKTYDASCVTLRRILQVTTEGAVVKQLLRWGVRVAEDDVMAATQCLSDSQIDVYEMVLSNSGHRDDILHSCVNLACNEALKMRKRNFVIALVKKGSTPPPDQLLEMGDVCEDPHVRSYLKYVATTAMMNPQLFNDDDPEMDVDSKVRKSMFGETELWLYWSLQNLCNRSFQSTM